MYQSTFINFVNIILLKIQFKKILYNCNLKAKRGIFDSCGNRYCGITQNPDTKDFVIIMDKYKLKNLKHITDQLLYKSGNKVVDDFIKHTQTNSNLNFNVMMEFVPYDQFRDIGFITEVESNNIYKAT